MLNRGMMSANSTLWGTPQAVFDELDKEFRFDLDPCPGEVTLKAGIRTLENGLDWRAWRPFTAAFVNPPYGRELKHWLGAAYLARLDAVRINEPAPKIVLLIPARTDTAWWHDLILPSAVEIRFIRGRLGFTGVTPKMEGHRHTKLRSRAPFPSVVVVL